MKTNLRFIWTALRRAFQGYWTAKAFALRIGKAFGCATAIVISFHVGHAVARTAQWIDVILLDAPPVHPAADGDIVDASELGQALDLKVSPESMEFPDSGLAVKGAEIFIGTAYDDRFKRALGDGGRRPVEPLAVSSRTSAAEDAADHTALRGVAGRLDSASAACSVSMQRESL